NRPQWFQRVSAADFGRHSSPLGREWRSSSPETGRPAATPLRRGAMFKFLRPALVLLAVFVVVGIAGVAYQGVQTLKRLTFVEADRDRWQRPADIIRALDVKDGNVVVDFGSGSGYFTLKLSDAVGPRGEVIAVDLRNLSLQFLRI